MSRRAPLTLVVAVPLLLAAAACEPDAHPAGQEEPVCEPPTFASDLPDEIAESSGVAASRAHPGVFWTHNDAGWDPVVFAIDSTGTILTTVRVDGATNRDWEDIELAPCVPGGTDHCLFIGDIGDNDERHSRIAVYRIPEPDPWTDTVSAPATAIRAVYSDGPRDAEALFVTDQGIYIINKGRSHAVDLFQIPAPYRPDQVVTLIPVQRLAPPPTSVSTLVTAAAASPTGDRVAVRTYGDITFFQIDGDTLAPLGRPATLVAPDQRQGEAVDFIDADRLILTTEAQGGHPASVAVVRCNPLREPTQSPPDTAP
jgi:hypothetical protein